MKILLMTDTFPPEITGGAAHVAFIQAKALQRFGHEVNVFSTRRDNILPEDSEIEGIPVHRIKVSYPLRWQAYLSLYNPVVIQGVKQFLAEVKPDIVHAHNIHIYLSYY